MNERDNILNKIVRRGRVEKPSSYFSGAEYSLAELISQFTANLVAGGGTTMTVNKDKIDEMIREIFGNPEKILNLSDHCDVQSIDLSTRFPDESERIDLFIVDGLIGVAGNGAVWLTEEKIGARRYPFIATDILILLPREQLVADLVQAYQKIELNTGFGIWIAGPSKTADIEQSLVFGAQGALRHTVFLIG
jgi:L-lactate dehydrogenase complex protein LldG